VSLLHWYEEEGKMRTQRGPIVHWWLAVLLLAMGGAAAPLRAAPLQATEITFGGEELLGKPTSSSITINIVPLTKIEYHYQYGTSSGSYTLQTANTTTDAGYPGEVVIRDLSPNTHYYYRMRYHLPGETDWVVRTEHSFWTQRAKGSPFVFTITSDAHATFNTAHQQAMTNIANDHPDLHLDLGDTFMVDGATSQTAVNNAYLAFRDPLYMDRIGHSAPIFLASGNHENEEGWNFDDTPFSIALGSIQTRKAGFPTPTQDGFYTGNTDPLAAIDEATYGDEFREDYYAWEWGDALFVVIDPFQYTMLNPYGNAAGEGSDDPATGDQWNWTLGAQQYNWLKQTLQNSNAKYKFMFSHQMLGGITRAISGINAGYVRGGAEAAGYFEWGGNNADGTPGFAAHRAPADFGTTPIHQLMVQYGVSAYFHGHDHQYVYEKRDGIVYQEVPSPSMSGSGFSGIYTEGDYGTYQTIEMLPNSGHLRVTVTPAQATVEYVSSGNYSTSGTINHSYTIAPNASGTTHVLTTAVSPTGGGTISPSAGAHTYDEGTVVSVTAAPASGYVFSSWSGACTGNGACSVNMDADKSVTAQFVVQSGSLPSSATPSDAAPDIGEQVVVSISADMSGVAPPDNALGSFTASLDWDPAVLQYSANSGIQAGFTGVVNTTNAGTGHIVFNGANAVGATGNFTLLTITFNVVGAGTSNLDLGYSVLAAATTFANLLPRLTVTDGQVVVPAQLTLTSPTATSILATTATLGANITSNGGATLTARGTCWGTTTPPTTNCLAAGGTGTGIFTQARTGLTAGTKLYYRGYATNSMGTGYSPVGSFYTEPATQASGVILSAPSVAGSGLTVSWTRGSGDGVIVLMKAGSAVNADPADGTYTGYIANPAFGSGTQIGTGNYVVYMGTGTSVSAFDLASNTTYHVAVYEYKGAVDTSGDAQGANYKSTPARGSRQTVNAPTVTSPTATSILATTATTGANVTSQGGSAVTARGTCWGATPASTSTCSTTGAGTGTGVFTHPISGLTAGTLIYYRGCAQNSAGWGCSSAGSFYTEPATQASAVSFTSVTGRSMTVNWTRGSGGDGVIVVMRAGSLPSTGPADGAFTTYSANTVYGSGTPIGSGYVVFKGAGTSVPVTGLTAGATYYVAVYEYKGAVDTSGVYQGTNYKPTPATGNRATPAFTSIASGLWSNPATWDQNAVPSSGDAVVIANGHTVTLSGDVTMTGSVTVQGTGKLEVGAHILTLNGAVTCGTINSAATGTVIYGRSGDQSVCAGAYGYLQISTGGTKTASGSVTVLDTLTVGSGATFVSASDYNNVVIDGTMSLTADITVSGNWTNNGTFTPGSYTVTFDGTGTQTIGGGSATGFYNLVIASTSTTVIPITATPTVANTLTNNGALQQTRTAGAGSTTVYLHLTNGGGGTVKYEGVEITPASSIGSTTVTVKGNQTCPEGHGSSRPVFDGTMIKRCYNIAPTTAGAGATTRFWFGNGTGTTDERNGLTTLGDINIYRWQPSAPPSLYGLWRLQGRNSSGTVGGFNYVDVSTASDEYGEFTGGLPGINLITLSSFTATPQGDGILLAWETASETDNAGFNLWRSEEEDGEYVRINPALIPAAGGPTFRAAYRFTDDAVEQGKAYYYRLEDVDKHGVSTFHDEPVWGPVGATAGAEQPGPGLWLPWIAR
jgi:hypothetical protein